jgi:hypothetical protein
MSTHAASVDHRDPADRAAIPGSSLRATATKPIDEKLTRLTD